MTFPVPANEIVEVLTELCRHEKLSEQVELLANSNAQFEEVGYDNWNGGTTSWALRLAIPLPQFAALKPRLTEIEKGLLAKLSYLDALHSNDQLGMVTILPLANNEVLRRQTGRALEAARIWHGEYVRVFISHTSAFKDFANQLKSSFLEIGVSAFVAHDDIQPTLEWQRELDLALNSMHVLVALVTKDFHESVWTNQEVGWAFGRGVSTIAVKLDCDPCGFLGAKQALSGDLDYLGNLADRLVELIMKDELTRPTMRSALAIAMKNSDSFRVSKRIAEILKMIDDFSDAEKSTLQDALTSNRQVYQATGVPAIINRIAPVKEKSDDPLF